MLPKDSLLKVILEKGQIAIRVGQAPGDGLKLSQDRGVSLGSQRVCNISPQRAVSLGRGDVSAGRNHQGSPRRLVRKGVDLRAPPETEGGAAVQEERHIAAQGFCQTN